MNWDQIEEDWVHVSGDVNERWGTLSDGQLAGRVQDTYGVTDRDDDAQIPLTDLQQHLSDIARAAR